MSGVKLSGYGGKVDPIETMEDYARPVKSRRFRGLRVGDVLEKIRAKSYGKRVSSDDFFVISNPSRECPLDGGCAIYIDNYVCPRCGEYVE